MTNQFATFRLESNPTTALLASTVVATTAKQLSAAMDLKDLKYHLVRVQVKGTWGATADGDLTIKIFHSVDDGVTYDTQSPTNETFTLSNPGATTSGLISFLVSETGNFKIEVTNGNSTNVSVVINALPLVWRKMSNDGGVAFEND